MRSCLQVLPALFLLVGATSGASAQNVDCNGYLTSLVVPQGYCVKVFASDLPPVRHLLLHPSGILVAATKSAPGLLRMEVGADGKVGKVTPFGPGELGTGVTWSAGWLYFVADVGLVRYHWPADKTEPDGEPQWLGRDYPLGREGWAHRMKGVAIGKDGAAYVSFGSATDNCQTADRQPQSPGQWPCTDLDTRAGIWRVAPAPGQTTGEWGKTRYATGLRNAMSIATDPVTGRIWAGTMSRDYLPVYWGWTPEEAQDQPAEMIFEIKKDADFGWPYCSGRWTNDSTVQIRAPEYNDKPVNCATKSRPALGFPGSWSPMAIAIPEKPMPILGRGLFIVFHGSRSRSPLPEDGHYVIFNPLDASGTPQRGYRIFLRSTDGPGALRASGMAIAPDGTAYVSDDDHGMIFRIEPHAPVRRGP